MTFLGLFILFAFGVVALTMLGTRGYQRLRELRAAVALFWGIGLAWLANLDMWRAWNITDLRYGWVGVTLTGAALAGTALILDALVGSLASLRRKLDDEAHEMESTELRRIA